MHKCVCSKNCSAIQKQERATLPLVLFGFCFVCLFVCLFWPYCAACGVSVPDQGLNLGPWQSKCQVLITGPSGNFLIQFSSVAQSCLTLCNSMNHSTPGLPVHHQFLEFTQTHIHRVSDAIQPSHPLSSPSPPPSNPSQHQSHFQ